MTSPASVTRLIYLLRSGDTAVRDMAARRIWQRDFRELLSLARRNLDRRARHRADEEDVLQSMFRSFCAARRAATSTWPIVMSSGGSWSRSRCARRATRPRHSGATGATSSVSRLPKQQAGCDSSSTSWELEQMDAAGPSPVEAVLLNEALERRLESLADSKLRQIALWRLEGYSNREIAEQLDCTERSVERKLERIRSRWSTCNDARTFRMTENGMSEIPPCDWSIINEAADAFELAWKRGPRPSIEDYVAGVAEPRRGLLLLELISVERELRLRDGEDPRPEEYHRRLPGDGLVIEAAFRPPASLPRSAGDDASVAAGASATVSFVPTIQRGVLSASVETAGPSRAVMLRDTWPADGPLSIFRSSSFEMPALFDGPGRLQLFGEMARGGMGAVLMGRDPDLGRDLAVKVLLDAHRDNPELVLRFVEEAQIAGQLQHPGVVPVYELGKLADSRPYFSMKLVRGRTLAEVLHDRPDPAHELSTHVATWLQICQTMAYAHARGVIHRDLKPSNVMLGNFGEVQVMDWGLAKVLPRGGVVGALSWASRSPVSRSLPPHEAAAARTATSRWAVWCWERRRTWPPSKHAARPTGWTSGATFSHSGRSFARSSPASRPSRARAPT